MDDIVQEENAAVSSGIFEDNVERRKMISMSLTKLHFQTKVIGFTNVFMYNHDIKMLREKIKESTVSSSNKWEVSNTMPLVHILSSSARAPLWKMARNKVNNLSTKEDIV